MPQVPLWPTGRLREDLRRFRVVARDTLAGRELTSKSGARSVTVRDIGPAVSRLS